MNDDQRDPRATTRCRTCGRANPPDANACDHCLATKSQFVTEVENRGRAPR
jgi:uncharacterized OB-fold protein